MFEKIYDRTEELTLLQFAIDTATANKELIEQLKAFEVETKPNGSIHKGKEKLRLAFIKRLETENKQLKKFYIERNVPVIEGTFDHHKYQYREDTYVKRRHLRKESK